METYLLEMDKKKDINEFINKIILGDSINVMKAMPSGKIDLIFADPLII